MPKSNATGFGKTPMSAESTERPKENWPFLLLRCVRQLPLVRNAVECATQSRNTHYTPPTTAQVFDAK